MFLFMLGGSLALGTGLFAVATFSEGTVLATRTAAQVIGWLFVLATVAGAAALRRDFASITAATVTLGSGLLLVYIAHFDWSEIGTMPSAYAAVEARPYELKVIEEPSPARGMKEIVIPDMPKAQPHKRVFAAAPRDFVVAFPTVEVLQSSRCSERLGLAWLLCQESVRLEYCESRAGDEASCPSPIPQSHPG